MKSLILVILAWVALICVASAQAVIKLNKDEHDFGNIDEGTIATYEFEITNVGDQPLIISEVQASCGCTTPYWTQEPILPGQKGKVTASYNSSGRPDAFVKSITIKSNASEPNKVVLIKGYVKPKSQQSTASLQSNLFSLTNSNQPTQQTTSQPPKQPDIRIDKVEHNFGNIEVKQRAKERFSIYNAGTGELTLLGFDSQCKCAQFGINSEILAPGQIGTLEINYVPEEAKYFEDVFTIYTNDPVRPQISIKLRANVYENFSKTMFLDKKEVAPFEY
ncbi:MAG: DUF1573 domain-containing protein [Microscillaceae bacterium]|nr:DUF1573 domain-containing protein [Microscillaceae bacterium]MDW8461583.1 DUF1573 domain-containing protein [Cytophagales bacterium]